MLNVPLEGRLSWVVIMALVFVYVAMVIYFSMVLTKLDKMSDKLDKTIKLLESE